MRLHVPQTICGFAKCGFHKQYADSANKMWIPHLICGFRKPDANYTHNMRIPITLCGTRIPLTNVFLAPGRTQCMTKRRGRDVIHFAVARTTLRRLMTLGCLSRNPLITCNFICLCIRQTVNGIPANIFS